MVRALAIDYGDSRVGIAKTDALGITAQRTRDNCY